ncbi:P-loop containing nucleoside triphosphate hydrolase protein [Auriculariales sp. MPI-PUGE-AT-0066]|nr:P-loop containing nucleoside triphosphate hydrolase protein [Auriculariales sp. MPI-PUGE-AT-0066]
MSLSIDVDNLSFYHGTAKALDDVTFTLRRGDRCLLIGHNGSGKSTLLQLVAGKRLIKHGHIRVFDGIDVFRQTPEGLTFLGTEWAMNPVVRGDIAVDQFLNSVGGYRYKERRDRLLDILDIDLDWRMHQISDGERRRVQLCMGLMAPWDILLLDEVTVDLDVLVRSELLAFLKEETETRGCTIVYATHIMDGIGSWPTHIAHLRQGELVGDLIPWAPKATSEALHDMSLRWLKQDRDLRRAEEASGKRAKTRGARPDVPSDAEAFYRKYDYSH